MHFYRYLPFKNPIGLLCRLIVSWKLGHKKIWFKILVGLTALRYIPYLSLYYWCQTINAFERKCFIGNEQSKNKQFLCSGKFMKWSCFCFFASMKGRTHDFIAQVYPKKTDVSCCCFFFSPHVFFKILIKEKARKENQISLVSLAGE